MNHTQSKLSNGATLITVPESHTQAVTVLVLFPVGSRYETPELNGISHFIEHMMFKGTTKRPSTLVLSRELDAVGAEYNAYTSKDYTGYYVRIDAAHLELALDIVSDMLWNSLFDAEELEREKGVIAEELHMYEDNPLMHIDEFLEEKMFDGSPLGWKIGGTDKIISKFDHDAMVQFRDRFYTPDKMCVAVAGKMPDDIAVRAEHWFGGHQRERSEDTKFIEHTFKSTDVKTVIKWKETEQAVLALGMPAYAYTDPRSSALNLIHTILGGSMSSRLFIEVRERRGLAYVIRTDVSPYHETGMFSVHMGLLPSRVDEALTTVMSELKKIKELGVTPEELKMAKDHIRGKMTLSLENSSALAEWFSKQYVLKGEIETPEQRMAKLDAVTLEDIRAVASDVINEEKFCLAVIGPFKDASVFDAKLSLS